MGGIVKWTVVLALTVFWTFAYAGEGYSVNIDLKNVEKDKVKVVCTVPEINEDEVLFVFPNIIPGSYALEEFGRYIEKFKAYGTNNLPLKIKKTDKYCYTIYNAKKLSRVEYYVNDSWEEKNGKRFIFQPAGTNISAGKSFVVNTFAFFGYLEGYKNRAYRLTFTKPADLEGSSYLKKTGSTSQQEQYTAENYDFLADNPIMFCKPDNTFFMVGGCKVNVCVYSATGATTAAKVAEELQPIGQALEKFFGKLPVDEYYFLFYFDDPKNFANVKGAGLSSGTGALEHNHCSFYYLLEEGLESDMRRLIREVCSHEFLHILTPLNLHSKEIADFNFRTPVMSQHLWMYEGVTEYFAGFVQLRDSLLTMKEYTDNLRYKISESRQFDRFSFTDMSKNVVTPENQKRYLSVYSRGALLAMMLDWTIIESTNGQMNLKKTMFQLSETYGPNRPFNDDELIDRFTAITSAEVGRFFQKYIQGSEQPDLMEFFSKIGYDYEDNKSKKGYYFGKFGVKYDPETKAFSFVKVGPNTFQLQNGDILLAVNGTEVTGDNAEMLITQSLLEAENENKAELKIKRGNEELTLSGKPVSATMNLKYYLAPVDEPGEKQKMVLNAWLNE